MYWILAGFAVGVGAKIIHSFVKADQEAAAEEKKRKSTPCYWNDGFTQAEFEATVYKCAKRIKRIKRVNISNLTVRCDVISQSGISEWSFLLDYNDYGHYTGKCWLSSRPRKSLCNRHHMTV